MLAEKNIVEILERNSQDYHPVVKFEPANDKIAKLDLSRKNEKFNASIYNDMQLFEAFIDDQRKEADAKYLLGGYNELREMYRRSELFGVLEEPRSLHLGIDVWGDAGTAVYAPLDGIVQSFRFNDNYGDYGATIILEHHIEDFKFYILYGHLALENIKGLSEGQTIAKGNEFASFGIPEENGHWPPHLHFQLILDIGNWKGDYPGVCKPSEADSYLSNSPDPAVFFQFKG